MNTPKSITIWPLVIIAALLAIVFDYLFFEKFFGISILVYSILVWGVLFWFSKKRGLSFKTAGWLSIPFFFFCLMPTIRANDFLTFLNVVGAIGVFLLMIRSVTRDSILEFSFVDYILTAVLWPLKFLHRSFGALAQLIRGAKNTPTGKYRKVLVGALAALPVLVFFGALFASADLAFRQFLQNSFAFNLPDTLVAQILVIIVIFIACLGWLAYMLNPLDKTTEEISDLLRVIDGGQESRKIEISAFLSLIGALFLVFILFQLNYLFGGATNITFGNFTYAEYARKGFAELVVVSVATLLILLGVDHYSVKQISRQTSTASDRRWLMIPALVIIAEVAVIMVSAFKRLALYENTYGLTELRLYVAGFIIFLAVVFGIFVAKLLLNKQHHFFAFGVVLALIAFVVSFNVLNPDKFIVQKNFAKFQGMDKLDLVYLTSLSPDALPTVLDRLEPRNEDEAKLLADYMSKNLDRAKNWKKHWQDFNFSRYEAAKALQKHAQKN